MNRRPVHLRLPPRRRLSGLTLVELMIATAIGLLVIGAMSALFAANSRTRLEIERAGQQVENGRFALEILRDDIRQAGFFGGFAGTGAAIEACVPRTGVPVTASNLGWSAATAQTPLALHGYAADEIPAAESCINNAKPESDVLIARTVEANPLPLATVGGSSFVTDWFVQVSACASGAIDPVTEPFIVAAGGPGAASRFTLHEKDCATPAPLWRLVVRAYYVGRCSVCTGSGDGIPTLRMVELSGATAASAAVVEGIEAFRVEYAFDLAGSGRIDAIRRCRAGVDPCSVADWARLAAVQVHVLSRSLAPTGDYRDQKRYELGLAGSLGPLNDGYRRRLYSALVSATNLAGPRER